MNKTARSNSPQQRLATAYTVIFFIAGMSIVLGLMAEMGVTFLQKLGQGISSIVTGVFFLILGFLVKRSHSKIALGVAMATYAIDAIFFFRSVTAQGTSSIAGGIFVRVAFLYFMYRGFAAIQELNDVPVYRNGLSINPNPTPVASSVEPVGLSFVAPGNRAVINKPITRPTVAVADVRPKPIAADFAAAALRYLVYRCEISASGLRAIYSSGKQKEYGWIQFRAMLIRQLPPDPPWEAKILMDLIPISTTGTAAPIRLFSTTYVNYSHLPQGVSPSSQENMRRLGLFILQQNPSVDVEPWTAQFLHSSKSPLRFANLSQFADYDAQYS